MEGGMNMSLDEWWERLMDCNNIEELYLEVAKLKTELDEVAEEFIFYNEWDKDIRSR